MQRREKSVAGGIARASATRMSSLRPPSYNYRSNSEYARDVISALVSSTVLEHTRVCGIVAVPCTGEKKYDYRMVQAAETVEVIGVLCISSQSLKSSLESIGS